MKSRLIASLGVSAAVLFATSGCALISTQATTISYSASDGVNVQDSGPLQVRNVLVVTDEEGVNGNLIAAIINDTDSSQTLTVAYSNGNQEVRVPAGTVLSLGADEDPVLLEGLDAAAGSDVEITFQSGDGDSVLVQVPVLDGTLNYLSPLVPEVPTPTPTVTATSTPTAPTPTPTAGGDAS